MKLVFEGGQGVPFPENGWRCPICDGWFAVSLKNSHVLTCHVKREYSPLFSGYVRTECTCGWSSESKNLLQAAADLIQHWDSLDDHNMKTHQTLDAMDVRSFISVDPPPF